MAKGQKGSKYRSVLSGSKKSQFEDGHNKKIVSSLNKAHKTPRLASDKWRPTPSALVRSIDTAKSKFQKEDEQICNDSPGDTGTDKIPVSPFPLTWPSTQNWSPIAYTGGKKKSASLTTSNLLDQVVEYELELSCPSSVPTPTSTPLQQIKTPSNQIDTDTVNMYFVANTPESKISMDFQIAPTQLGISSSKKDTTLEGRLEEEEKDARNHELELAICARPQRINDDSIILSQVDKSSTKENEHIFNKENKERETNQRKKTAKRKKQFTEESKIFFSAMLKGILISADDVKKLEASGMRPLTPTPNERKRR